MSNWLTTKLADDKKINELSDRVNNAIKNMNLNIILFGKEVDRVREQKDKEWLEENYSKPFFSQYIKWLKRNINTGWNSDRGERLEKIQQFLERKKDDMKN